MRENENTRARALRPKAVWIQGSGEYASISDCPRGPTIILHRTREQAERAKAFIDRLGCGGRCLGEPSHSIVHLTAPERNLLHAT
jgi:hypothetical protein